MKYGEVYYEISDRIVIDTAKYKQLTAAKLNELASKLAPLNKPMLFIDNLNKFFMKKTLVENLVAGKDVSVMLELQEVDLDASDHSTIAAFKDLLTKINGVSSVSIGEYKFQPLNENFNLYTYIGMKPNEIRHQQNGYTIKNDRAEAIWNFAFEYWSGRSEKKTKRISVDGYERNVRVTDATLVIGCTTIERFVVEQLALEKGWSFA